MPSLTVFDEVVSTAFPCLAVAITTFRLVIQYRRRQLWWEDLWAAVAMACTIGLVSAYWWFTIVVAEPHPDKPAFVISWWLSNVANTCALWAARTSFTFSFIRISHPASRLRVAANLTAGIFACCFAAQIIQKVCMCRDVKSWMDNTTQGCDVGDSVGITGICMDVVSDVLLVAMASRLLRSARQLKSQRKLIRGLFSASILTTVFSIVHAVFVIRADMLLVIALTGYLETSMALIVCNLPVVVTCLYRHYRRMHAEDAYDYATDTSSDRASLENTLDATAITQTNPIYSADLMGTISTQNTNTFQSQKSLST
ncbi:hypothetical protein FIBSPDRAFT_149821 [Athelia psychrophila]|uniref:Rhodopsin domain-containing protein n=1 Tax=Athelia psychrophila TaxID=1759441 RepID=A0A166BLS3_9AGAM|nr:hypothetical protein FIBSPDRAFT_1055683 [Fibularhizoctonia sp. CBS 109695]KZP12772.1 hypothetical protein FIBSPDRAFT_149821 [Fibularhizoctonia sp. CBS 109695]